ncbi:PREDICTED: transmembrane protein 261 isoform X1 [Myotis brandtii]|uniref:transmembrane protein 261 isoform X1 n=1 Tax=Myotis brandtii TaxID=109478 RepID=UPI000703D712|nr:PREDICTED: transmembrane protein 261 isoform X1 [Myotis brandtii]
MGTFLSQPLETDKIASAPQAASSASRTPLDAPGAPTSPEQPPALRNCWSCRVLSGSGLIGAGWHCLLGCNHPVRPQGEVPPVNLSSVPVSMTHRASIELMDVLDRHMDIGILQFCRYYKTEKTNISWQSLAMSVCGLLGLHKDQ